MDRSLNRLLSPVKDVKPGIELDGKGLGQLLSAKHQIFKEICREIHVENHSDIRVALLNKRTVSKELLCFWLESVGGLVDFCIPKLTEVMLKYEKQNKEMISSQAEIIKLRAQVIQKKEQELAIMKDTVKEELKSVQRTVQSEMKSYSAVLTKTCSAALSEKKISSAVKLANDKEDRKKNVVFHGVLESNEELLHDKVSEILLGVEEKPVIKECCRIGLKKGTAPRPVKLSLGNSDIVQQVHGY